MYFRSLCNYCPNLDQVPNVILDQIPQKELDQSNVDHKHDPLSSSFMVIGFCKNLSNDSILKVLAVHSVLYIRNFGKKH